MDKMNMIEFVERKEECCGCYACFNVCPVHAIEMRSDEEGFSYPELSKEKCINCGKCEKACPLETSKRSNL